MPLPSELVDQPDDNKLEAYVEQSVPNCATFKIFKEDHTIGGLLRKCVALALSFVVWRARFRGAQTRRVQRPSSHSGRHLCGLSAAAPARTDRSSEGADGRLHNPEKGVGGSD